jgi:hypothetical protein
LAEAELIIQNSTDKEQIDTAKAKVFAISSKIRNFEDMCLLDELTQGYLSKNS